MIPQSQQQKVLSSLHAAHQGVTKMFWPGITPDIVALRAGCCHGNRMAPSQPSATPTPPLSPVYPFQCICADFFHYAGVNYLVIVDRYSNWPIVEKTADGAKGLIAALPRTFVTYGISEELASDGGSEFTATITRQFLSIGASVTDYLRSHSRTVTAVPRWG